MAFANFDAIRTAVSETLRGLWAPVRALAPGTFDDDIFSGTLLAPKFQTLISYDLHADSPPEPSLTRLYSVAVVIRTSYTLPTTLPANVYAASKARAEQDADVMAQALGWPG